MKNKTKIARTFKNHPIKFIIKGILFLLILNGLGILSVWIYQNRTIQLAMAQIEYQADKIKESVATFNERKKRMERYLNQEERNWVLDEVLKAGLNQKEALCLIDHESSWDAEVSPINYDNRGGVDRGLWAINSKWHSEVSNGCAFDYKCATKEAIRIRLANGNWNQWHGYTNNCN